MRTTTDGDHRGVALSLATICFAFFVAACATSLQEPPIAATPAQIPALRAFFRNDTGNIAKRLRLAEAERLAGQLTDAALLLEPVAETTPVAGFYLGLVREDQGRPAEARRLFERYLARRPTGELSDQVRAHLAVLSRSDTVARVGAARQTTDLATSAAKQIPAAHLAALQATNPFRAVERLVPDPLTRDASVEAFGAEGFGRSGVAEIVIQRPAGTGPGSSASRAPR